MGSKKQKQNFTYFNTNCDLYFEFCFIFCIAGLIFKDNYPWNVTKSY